MSNFYGKPISFLKFFGQKRVGDCSLGRVTGKKIFHAAGILVDRTSTPPHIYVADTGNNRILGFRSFDSPLPELIFGQPDQFSGAPNGDCNTGMFRRPSRASLCLMCIPVNPNQGEQWMRLNFDVDAEGNLYVPDFYNNRVLVYRAPFSADKTNGKGDNLADFVLGQPDFESNGINRGNGRDIRDEQSLYLSYGGFDFVASRGVSVDGAGNVWVADTFNYRVLRFPKGSTIADLVLGQPDFHQSFPQVDYNDGNAPLNRMCTPTLARVNPDTGELYVIDEYRRGFPARILVFEPPFTDGMSAARKFIPKQILEKDYAAGYRPSSITGLMFNPVKTDDLISEPPDTRTYRDGELWLQDSGPNGAGKRMILLDRDGNILVAVGAPDTKTFGGRFDTYGHVGMQPEEPFNLIWPGGAFGFDSDNNIYLADEEWYRIARYALPYRVEYVPQPSPPNPPTHPNYPKLPLANGGLFPGTLPNSFGPAQCFGPGIGAITFGGQLIVRDFKRYMVWNNYLTNENGSAADIIVGQDGGFNIDKDNLIYNRSMHVVDHLNRLWMTDRSGKLMVYQLPLKRESIPLKAEIPLYWKDDLTELPYTCFQALTFHRRTRTLWVYDNVHYRLLRVVIPEDIKQDKFVIATVIGQKKKTDDKINRGMPYPDAASLGDVNDIRFDKFGNLFVVDNTYECHQNARVIAFMAEDLASMHGTFPDIQAKKVYVAQSFRDRQRCQRNVNRPHSPVCVAFNSRNEMVLGNDGYYVESPVHDLTRHIRQLYLYRQPLRKATPDAAIELPLGAPGEISFDDQDNLIVQDHIWNKVWVINYDRDPAWLVELDTSVP